MEKFRYFFAIRRLLRSKKFDLVLDMQGLFKSAILAFFSGCKTRFGYCEMRELSGFVSKAIRGEMANAHVIERYLDVARFLGAKIDNIEFPIADLSEAEKSAGYKLKNAGVSGKYVVLAPGARWKTKEWPLEYYAKLAYMINKDGFFVVLVGSVLDKQKSQKIKMLAKNVVDLTGETNLKELAAIIKASFFYISADTGPLHFASAFKKSLIAIYGPTLANRTGPYANDNASVVLTPLSCAGCLKKKCGNWHCMSEIEPQTIYHIFKKKIGKIDG